MNLPSDQNIRENTKKSMVEYLVSNEFMNPIQHGFRRKKSTISQMLSFYDDITSKPESGDDIDTIYLDFSKAFDNVGHHILLHDQSSQNHRKNS